MIAYSAMNCAKIVNCAGYAQVDGNLEDPLYNGESYVGYNNITISELSGKNIQK